MKIFVLFAAAVMLSSTLVVGLPLLQPKYSTHQTQEEYLREHGYYGICTHFDAVYSRPSDTKELDSAKTEEGRRSFEGDFIVRVEVTESGESEDQGPVDSTELLFWKAVLCFQRKSGLPQTGIVNEETRKEMETQSKAPSGAHNRKKRFITSGEWKKNDLTYYIANYDVDRSIVSITEEVIRSEIQRAIKAWTDVSGLRVTEKNSTDADIIIGFYPKDHKDGFPFDGNGRILAHAFMPQDGDIHLEASESWSAYTERGQNLFYVMLHEFGHSIGLRHSEDRYSVMGAELKSYDPNRELAEDDVLAVQSLYGPIQNLTTMAEKTTMATKTTVATKTTMATKPTMTAKATMAIDSSESDTVVD